MYDIDIDTTIFEPEFSFLPFACDACGARATTEALLEIHQRETCWKRFDHARGSSAFDFELHGDRGIADGGRRT